MRTFVRFGAREGVSSEINFVCFAGLLRTFAMASKTSTSHVGHSTVKPSAFSDRFFMHGESAIQTALCKATTCLTRPATGIFCTNDWIFPVFSDQKTGKVLLCPHLYCQNSHHSASLRENHRMRQPLAPDWRELSLSRSNVCVPQRSQLFNTASKIGLFSGKPCLRDHLSRTTIFPCTAGWLLKTGFTVA